MTNLKDLFLKLESGVNWETIYNVMKLLDWHWAIDKKNNYYGIPDITTIKKSVFKLAENAYKKETTVSSGGFTVGYDSECNDLWLSFTIEEVYSSEI